MILKKIKENKEFILQIIEIILIIIFGIFIVSTVNIKTTPELGFCPYVHSGSQSGTNERICKADRIEIRTDNEGYFKIETEIFNRGLALALDTELEIDAFGAIFEMSDTDSQYSKNSIDIYIDDQKIVGNSPIRIINGAVHDRERIHVLKPTDSKKITLIFPENFGFYVRPSKVVFTLKENGDLKGTKTIFVNYSYRKNCKIKLGPPLPSPIFLLVKSNNNPINSANVTVRNLQTGNYYSYNTNELGEFATELENFDKCWEYNDIIEIEVCKNKICKKDYSKVDESLGVINKEIDLSN